MTGVDEQRGRRVLVIDNYDSFTYNLVQYLGELGATIRVRRNDEVTVGDVAAMQPAQILISPGPGRPEDAGVSMDVIRHFGPTTPLLGVCLGHQAIGQVYGGTVCRANVPMHGKTSTIVHDGKGVFSGITAPIQAGRYHSLIIANENLVSAAGSGSAVHSASSSASTSSLAPQSPQAMMMGAMAVAHATLPDAVEDSTRAMGPLLRTPLFLPCSSAIKPSIAARICSGSSHSRALCARAMVAARSPVQCACSVART